jgi:hypothetical protein
MLKDLCGKEACWRNFDRIIDLSYIQSDMGEKYHDLYFELNFWEPPYLDFPMIRLQEESLC